jgi:hypothetical protein
MIEASAWNGSTESFDKLRVTVFGETLTEFGCHLNDRNVGRLRTVTGAGANW